MRKDLGGNGVLHRPSQAQHLQRILHLKTRSPSATVPGHVKCGVRCASQELQILGIPSSGVIRCRIKLRWRETSTMGWFSALTEMDGPTGARKERWRRELSTDRLRWGRGRELDEISERSS